MSNYAPEQWILVKINGTDPHYRVFGSWRGGFVSSDSWRMNSGIVRVEDCGDFYQFYGHSGSCYACHKEHYGRERMGPYNNAVLSQYCDNSQGTVVAIEEMPDIMNVDWIIG